MSGKIKWPLMLIIAVLMILAMLRLGIWQLSRADQKQTLLDQKISRADQPPVALANISAALASGGSADNPFRFRSVSAQGKYLSRNSIYIDNQVVDGQVGYRVFTPIQLRLAEQAQITNQQVVLVDRGWIGVGESRSELPTFYTESNDVTIHGRLNIPPAQPPLWNDAYDVAQGQVWAYLPIEEYAEQMSLSVLPLVIELAPEDVPNPQFTRRLAKIDDEWVAKHHGYAFQWFAMALAFFVACLVLCIRQFKRQSISEKSTSQ